MNKIIVSLLLALGLVASTSAFAADSGLFKGNEFSLTLASGYTLSGYTRSTAFANPYDFNLDVGAKYFFSKYVGVEADVPFYQTKGVSFDQVHAGLIGRLPVGIFAPYVGLGGDYNWQTAQAWTYTAKAGLEVRLNSKWGVFAEGRYENKDFSWGQGVPSVRGGLNLVLW